MQYTEVKGGKRRGDGLHRYLTGLADYKRGNVSLDFFSRPGSPGYHVLMLVIDMQCLNGITHLDCFRDSNLVLMSVASEIQLRMDSTKAWRYVVVGLDARWGCSLDALMQLEYEAAASNYASAFTSTFQVVLADNSGISSA